MDEFQSGILNSDDSSFSIEDDVTGDFMEQLSTLNIEEESCGTNPVYNWSDDKIDDGEFEGFPMLSVDQTIKLGEVMLIMVCQGPLHRLEEIVTALALNLRDPADLAARVFSAIEGGDPPAPGTALYDISSPATIQGLQNLCEVQKYRIEEKEYNKIRSRRIEEKNRIEGKEDNKITSRIEDKKRIKGKEYNKIRSKKREDRNRNEGKGTEIEFYNSRCAIKEFIYEMSKYGISDDEKATLFCFMAASLVRCGVKNRKAMTELWSKSILKFNSFYRARNYARCKLILSRPAYQILNRGFRPGSVLLKTVLRSFLKKSCAPDVSDKVSSILDFTLLTHTRYNGMRLVTLVKDAFKKLGKKKIDDLQIFDTEKNRSGIAALKKHFISCKGQPLHGSKYLPWCRLFDRNYCSNLSPKDHPSLAILLMCLIENTKKDIWNMRSVRATEECKTESKKIVEKINMDNTQALLADLEKFGSPGSRELYLFELAINRLSKAGKNPV